MTRVEENYVWATVSQLNVGDLINSAVFPSVNNEFAIILNIEDEVRLELDIVYRRINYIDMFGRLSNFLMTPLDAEDTQWEKSTRIQLYSSAAAGGV